MRVAFAPNKIETAELLSKMAGTRTVQKASFNFSGSRFSPVMSHMNASVDHVERPLMTPDEVMRIKPPKKEGEGDAEIITEPGDMLIFVSGHYPILGMQMPYFFDPEFALRAAIAPPKSFESLRNGKLVAQSPDGHTSDVISEPELVENAESTSELERGFVEELKHCDADLLRTQA